MSEVHYRDAGTGEFVSEEYAREHPDTTVREVEKDDAPREQSAPESGDEAAKIEQAFDPTQPVYTGDGAAPVKEADVPEVDVETGNAADQVAPE